MNTTTSFEVEKAVDSFTKKVRSELYKKFYSFMIYDAEGLTDKQLAAILTKKTSRKLIIKKLKDCLSPEMNLSPSSKAFLSCFMFKKTSTDEFLNEQFSDFDGRDHPEIIKKITYLDIDICRFLKNNYQFELLLDEGEIILSYYTNNFLKILEEQAKAEDYRKEIRQFTSLAWGMISAKKYKERDNHGLLLDSKINEFVKEMNYDTNSSIKYDILMSLTIIARTMDSSTVDLFVRQMFIRAEDRNKIFDLSNVERTLIPFVNDEMFTIEGSLSESEPESSKSEEEDSEHSEMRDSMKKFSIGDGEDLQKKASGWVVELSQNEYWLFHASKGHFNENLADQYFAICNKNPSAEDELVVKNCPICAVVKGEDNFY